MAGGATRVRIYNHYYDLLGDDPERIEKLARLVDDKMIEISRTTPTVDTAKVAVLAALNIAGQLVDIESRVEELEREYEQRSDELIGMISRETASLSHAMGSLNYNGVSDPCDARDGEV